MQAREILVPIAGTDQTIKWIRAAGLKAEEFERLAAKLGLHPLAVEDTLSPKQRPKVEAYPNQTFAIVRIPRISEDDLMWAPVGIFLTKDGIITGGPQLLPELDALEGVLLNNPAKHPKTLDQLFHMIIDVVVDAWFPHVQDLEEFTEAVEEESLTDSSPAVFAKIQGVKGLLSRIRKVSNPMREAFEKMEREPFPHISDETRLLIRDVSDHMRRIQERLDHVREISQFAQESWHATLARQQNNDMRKLTIVAAVLLVPSLLAGLGGMNFPGMPDWPYWIATIAILGIAFTGFLFFLIRGRF